MRPMECRIEEANYLGDYRVSVCFKDGRRGVVDVRELDRHGPGSVFARLQDETFARLFTIAHGTLSWPGELDVAPEFLYFLAFRTDPALYEQFVEWGYLASARAGS